MVKGESSAGLVVTRRKRAGKSIPLYHVSLSPFLSESSAVALLEFGYSELESLGRRDRRWRFQSTQLTPVTD